MIMATISALKPFSLLFILLYFASLSETSDITRLTGGRNSLEGRVEVQYAGKWGTVCSDFFTDKAAYVVCKEIGYNGSLAFPFFGSYFSNPAVNTSQPIWLDDVTCTGTEEWIGFCTHRTWGQHDCNHQRDVGVACLPPPASLPVRLAGGVHEYEGRLEVQVINGSWVPVCSSGWDKAAAQVVCKQLGFDSTYALGFDAGSLMNSSNAQQLTITLHNLHCHGSESNIFQCQRDSLDLHSCDYFTKMAGVVCSSPPSLLPVRLVGGKNNKTEGRVEVQLISGEWGTICASSWDDKDAQVVCNQLGLNGTIGHAFSALYFTNNTGIPDRPAILSTTDCVGNENWIGGCPHADFSTNTWCSFNDDKAGVVCSVDAAMPIRLAGGSSSLEGRVEIQFPSGQWGTVCDDSFDDVAAQVLCSQLGFPSYNSKVICCSWFTNGTGNPDLPILLDEVLCNGDESSIQKCQHNNWGSNDCDHTEDVGVLCGPGEFHISATNNEVVSLPLHEAATCWLEKGCPHYAVPVNLTHAVLIAINTTCGNPVSVVGTYSKPDSGHAVGLTAIAISSETPGDRLRIPLPTVLGEPFYVTVSTTSSNKDCKTTLLPHLRGDSFDVIG